MSMKKKTISNLLLWGGVLVFCACGSDVVPVGPGDAGARLAFVPEIRSEEPLSVPSGSSATRSSSVLPPEASTLRLLEGFSSDGSPAFLVESTSPRMDAASSPAETRATVAKSISSDFSTLGLRSASATIPAGPFWFHNVRTGRDGTPYEELLWERHSPYARFYAVSPLVDAGQPALSLSPSTLAEVPYVDFEVASAVRDQQDLMTATSGLVHYDSPGTAPQVHLAFRHALTAVRFSVGPNLSWGTIRKIEIRNAFGKGRYRLSSENTSEGTTASWDMLSRRTTFTLDNLNVSTKGLANELLTGKDGDNFTFYMIPQQLTGQQVEVVVSFASENGQTPNTITATLTGSWKAGTTKTYKISNTKSNWEYYIQAESPEDLAHDASLSGLYRVRSFRMAPDGSSQPVPWRVVSYAESADGGSTWSGEIGGRPEWLLGLSQEQGVGGQDFETGVATVRVEELVDSLAEYNGVLQQAPAKGGPGNYWNLSNATGASGIQNTANCYVISAPGYYRIPLVYGNAVKESSTNSAAYNTSGQLRRFLTHAGATITSPYINMQYSTNPATQAGLVWADAEGLVEDLSVSGTGASSFVQFRVPAQAIRNGNAVIAVKNASGVVMWSWHLWFAQADVLQTVSVRNNGGATLRFSAVNLGFAHLRWEATPYKKRREVRVKVEQEITDGGEKKYAYVYIRQLPYRTKKSNSTYYQFGRKDAFPGTDNLAPGSSFVQNGGSDITYAKTVQNPGTFYVWGNSWTTNYHWANLWSASKPNFSSPTGTVVKTVLDPSPVGFHLPPADAFSGFSSAGLSSGSPMANPNTAESFRSDEGWHFRTSSSSQGTIFFHALGCRRYTDAVFHSWGTRGYYWVASARGTQHGYVMFFDETRVVPASYTDRSAGCSVRPVAE